MLNAHQLAQVRAPDTVSGDFAQRRLALATDTAASAGTRRLDQHTTIATADVYQKIVVVDTGNPHKLRQQRMGSTKQIAE